MEATNSTPQPSKPSKQPQDPAALGVGRSAAVIIASTSAANGTAADTTGPVLTAWLKSRGYHCDAPIIVADGQPVAQALQQLLALPAERQPRFIITSGGTGLNPDDATPDLTAPLLDKPTPGIMHALWTEGLRHTPCAVMSRGVAGVTGRTFIINLPGSRGGVNDGITVLDGLLKHIQEQIEDVRTHARTTSAAGDQPVASAGAGH